MRVKICHLPAYGFGKGARGVLEVTDVGRAWGPVRVRPQSFGLAAGLSRSLGFSTLPGFPAMKSRNYTLK